MVYDVRLACPCMSTDEDTGKQWGLDEVEELSEEEFVERKLKYTCKCKEIEECKQNYQKHFHGQTN